MAHVNLKQVPIFGVHERKKAYKRREFPHQIAACLTGVIWC